MKLSAEMWIRLLSVIMTAALGVAAFVMNGPRWAEFLAGIGFAFGLGVQWLLWTTGRMADDDSANELGLGHHRH